MTRGRRRFELTGSYDIGRRDILRADSEQACRDELAELVTYADRHGFKVIAWNIAPILELPTGIAVRNTRL